MNPHNGQGGRLLGFKSEGRLQSDPNYFHDFLEELVFSTEISHLTLGLALLDHNNFRISSTVGGGTKQHA